MASIFKPTYTKIDPKTSEKQTRKLKKWYVKYRDANGVIKRVPGFTDKAATNQLAAKLEKEAELEKAGIFDPFKKHRTRPLNEHLAEFEANLNDKDNTTHYVGQTLDRVRKLIDWCEFHFINDISASQVEAYLGDLRSRGRGKQTSNHYLSAIKEFCRWLVTDRRTGTNPIFHLKKLNVKLDRRHDRRPLAADEFQRLVDAAVSGDDVQCISGHERAMLYVLAAWTGYRRGELASLTDYSFNFDVSEPVVRVEAAYSKRRRKDVVPLHPIVVERLKAWLAENPNRSKDTPVFSLRTPAGNLRDTAEMMRRDLKVARTKWISEAADPEEERRRQESDYLCYQDSDGLFADFHSNRHTFITNLGKAGVAPKVAQMLARHSDINLTMGVYTHLGLNHQTSAVQDLPTPPTIGPSGDAISKVVQAPATDCNESSKNQEEDDRSTGNKREHGPQHVQKVFSDSHSLANLDKDSGLEVVLTTPKKNQLDAQFDASCHPLVPYDIDGTKHPLIGTDASSEPRVGGSNPPGCTYCKPCQTQSFAYLTRRGQRGRKGC